MKGRRRVRDGWQFCPISVLGEDVSSECLVKAFTLLLTYRSIYTELVGSDGGDCQRWPMSEGRLSEVEAAEISTQ